MEKLFSSETSKDQINIILIKKSHKAIFKLISIDETAQHLNLIELVDVFLKKEDIKWVEFLVVGEAELIIPTNAITYKNKYNNNMICHIEDFQKFYLSNISDFIKINHVHVDICKKSEDGWKMVSAKHNKRDKYDQIILELSELIGDWNNLA